MAPALVGEQTWIWACVEVNLDGTNGRCVFRICKKKADAINNKPRGTEELTRFIKCHAWPGNTMSSDGWAATKAINWHDLGLKHDWCNHSRTLKKGIRRLTRSTSAESTESQTHATKDKGKGKFIKRNVVQQGRLPLQQRGVSLQSGQKMVPQTQRHSSQDCLFFSACTFHPTC